MRGRPASRAAIACPRLARRRLCRDDRERATANHGAGDAMNLILSRHAARILGGAAVAAAMLAIAGTAHAQYGDVFGSTRPGPGDREMVRERAQTLLNGPADAQ